MVQNDSFIAMSNRYLLLVIILGITTGQHTLNSCEVASSQTYTHTSYTKKKFCTAVVHKIAVS